LEKTEPGQHFLLADDDIAALDGASHRMRIAASRHYIDFVGPELQAAVDANHEVPLLDVALLGAEATLTRVQSSPDYSISALDHEETNLLIWGVSVHEVPGPSVLKSGNGELKYTVLRPDLSGRYRKITGGCESGGWENAESGHGGDKKAPTKCLNQTFFHDYGLPLLFFF
jgi:hypothetical protein